MKSTEIEQQTSVPVKEEKKAASKKRKPPIKRLLLPAFIFVFFVTQIPFIVTIYFSFQRWNIMRPDLGVTFNGWGNYQRILTESAFWQVVSNTLLLTSASLFLCLVLGMTFALLMNRDFIGRGMVRTMLVTPFFVMPAVSGIVWKNLVMNPNYGLTEYFASLIGTRPVDLLAQYPLLTIIIIVTWMWTPFFMLILLAGLQSVSKELIESAQLDGANKLQTFFYIVIPHLLRYIEVVLLLGLIFILQIFGKLYVTTSGGPGYSSTNLSFYTFRTAFQSWDIGGAATIGVITVVMTIAVMMVLFLFLRRTFKGELS